MGSNITRNEAGERTVYAVELPVYKTMKDCSAATGIPVSLLKHAKDNGCNIDPKGRINLGEFLRWFFSRDATGEDANYDKRLKRAKALTAEAAYEENVNRTLIPFDVVSRFTLDLWGNCVFGELERLAQEFPATLKGKTEVAIHKEVTRQIDAIVKKVRSKLFSLDGMGPTKK